MIMLQILLLLIITDLPGAAPFVPPVPMTRLQVCKQVDETTSSRRGQWSSCCTGRTYSISMHSSDGKDKIDDFIPTGTEDWVSSVRSHVQGNDKWRDSYWVDFFEELAVFLHCDAIGFKDEEVAGSIRLLMEKGVISISRVLDCGNDRPTFVGTMNAIGLSAAVANAVFRKYVDQEGTHNVPPSVSPAGKCISPTLLTQPMCRNLMNV
jgi:hypothetical protein